MPARDKAPRASTHLEELNLLMLRQKELACFSPCRRMFPAMFKEAIGMTVNLRHPMVSLCDDSIRSVEAQFPPWNKSRIGKSRLFSFPSPYSEPNPHRSHPPKGHCSASESAAGPSEPVVWLSEAMMRVTAKLRLH